MNKARLKVRYWKLNNSLILDLDVTNKSCSDVARNIQSCKFYKLFRHENVARSDANWISRKQDVIVCVTIRMWEGLWWRIILFMNCISIRALRRPPVHDWCVVFCPKQDHVKFFFWWWILSHQYVRRETQNTYYSRYQNITRSLRARNVIWLGASGHLRKFGIWKPYDRIYLTYFFI